MTHYDQDGKRCLYFSLSWNNIPDFGAAGKEEKTKFEVMPPRD